jgi:ribosomal protein S18 acetylase RimI-like enzyme
LVAYGVTVRGADKADVPGIAAVRVAAWRAAYRGILEASVLEALDSDQDARRFLADWPAGPVRRVAVRAGDVVGFTLTGPYRVGPDDRPDWTGSRQDGEIYGIYVEPMLWSCGVGRALMLDALELLRAAQYQVVRLWVLKDNVRARRFYHANGFTDEEPAGVVKRYLAPAATRAALEVRYSRALR